MASFNMELGFRDYMFCLNVIPKRAFSNIPKPHFTLHPNISFWINLAIIKYNKNELVLFSFLMFGFITGILTVLCGALPRNYTYCVDHKFTKSSDVTVTDLSNFG